jgi:hypothetical protein
MYSCGTSRCCFASFGNQSRSGYVAESTSVRLNHLAALVCRPTLRLARRPNRLFEVSALWRPPCCRAPRQRNRSLASDYRSPLVTLHRLRSCRLPLKRDSQSLRRVYSSKLRSVHASNLRHVGVCAYCIDGVSCSLINLDRLVGKEPPSKSSTMPANPQLGHP